MNLNKFFGQGPKGLFGLKVSTYNSLMGVVGAFAYADTIPKTIGLILMVEAVLVSIERCWPKEERPE